LSFLSFSVIS